MAESNYSLSVVNCLSNMAGVEVAQMREKHYRRLLWMVVLSLVSMYVLMYAMVDALANVYGNLNQLYMAGLMAAPMGVFELLVMSAMYRDKRMNLAIMAASLAALIGCWVLIRQQTAISTTQFLRSMIPHHAGAILMCQEAAIDDAEIEALCKRIISSQEAEIAQMKARLRELEKGLD